MTLRNGQGRLFGERAVELAGFSSALLGWRPDEFWSSTPAEFETALGGEQTMPETMDRAAVDRLRAQFPDKRER